MEQIPLDKFKHACLSSKSIKDTIEFLGGRDNGKWRTVVRKLSKQHNIPLPKYTQEKWEKIKKECPICKTEFITLKGHGREKITCSYSCSNSYFRRGKNNGNYKNSSTNYRKKCIEKHGSCCILCGFNTIIEAHHIDGDRRNNKPNNLVPLCPNHHSLIHSKKYRTEIIRELRKKLNGDVV